MRPGSGSRRGYDSGVSEEAPDVRLRLRGNDLIITFKDAPPGGSGGSGDPGAAGQAGELRAEVEQATGRPALVYDRRLGSYRTLALAYRAVRERLEGDHYSVGTDFDPVPPLPFAPRMAQQARPYQQAALDAWAAAGGRGVVVLPTGAGKTLVALLATARQGLWTLIVVPTLDLLEQWRRAAVEVLGAPPEHVGVFGGGRRDLTPITVITYDSAAIHTRDLNRFGLLVFDEVHHLPAASYRLAAEGTMAPYRLGLSATPDRTDGLESDLAHLVGPVVYSRSPRELAAHLAPYREERIAIALSPDEQAAYEAAMATYRAYLRRNRLRITSPEDFQRLVIWPSATNPEARRAMLAQREARRLSFNAGAKTAVLLDLLERHRADRVLIFSEFSAVVEGLSRDLLIPSITYRTPAAERAAILEGFRSGRFSKLVTGRVLNEGVDVPDASVAILLSGTATRREYVQRLGRVLRPKAGPAVLYELVTEETGEMHVTRRRHRGGREPGAAPVRDGDGRGE
jgi:superfamily II DNA or RNA helicase